MPAINGGLDLAARLAARRHPALFERLAAVPDPTFALLPRELPIAVIVRADTRRPKIRIIPAEKLDPTRVAATIRGPLRLLAALADGSQDGDALFFSRRIAIEGDTEAAVALRNALDNADLSGLAELVLPPGPAARTAQRLLRMGGRFLEIMHDRAGRTPPGAGSSP
ncbi:MAG: sterol-binding protein [Alphaproteobacteria bacterium]|nr:sterol-binding protein [Alphaproteobacteria bacterium]